VCPAVPLSLLPAEMQGGFEKLLSSFPSDCLICSDASILSVFLIPLPNHLGKYPGKQLLANPSKCRAHPLSQTEEILLKAAEESNAPVLVLRPKTGGVVSIWLPGPVHFSILGNRGGEGKRVWCASFR